MSNIRHPSTTNVQHMQAQTSNRWAAQCLRALAASDGVFDSRRNQLFIHDSLSEARWTTIDSQVNCIGKVPFISIAIINGKHYFGDNEGLSLAAERRAVMVLLFIVMPINF